MKKITALLLILIISVFTLTGCWSYKEIESLIIVSGAAIDKSDDGKKYHLTIETINLSGEAKSSQPKSTLFEADGYTIYDAARNAKKMATTKFYWSNCQVIILSQAVASEGIISALDLFVRTPEPRNTIEVLVSRDKTAREILTNKGIINPIVSFEIDKIIETDAQFLSTASYIDLNNIFNTLNSGGKSLVLPVVQSVLNDKSLTNVVNGDSVFMEDKLIGFLTAEETKYSIFVKNKVKGGVLQGQIDGAENRYALDILKSNTKITHEYKNGILKMRIDIKTDTGIYELATENNFLHENGIKLLEDDAKNNLGENVKNVIERVQKDYGTDIFGFGESINKSDRKLWKMLEDNWNDEFKNLQVEVNVKVNIKNTSFLKSPIKVGE